MFKALNDISNPDFSERFQLNESLYGLMSSGPQKLSILFPISTLLNLEKVLFNTLVQ